MHPDGHSFRVLTYNILARSLGSNTIPWVLNVSPQTRARIEDKTGEAFGTWRRTAVDEEYKRHWHKNFHSGDYAAMRALYGQVPPSREPSCRRESRPEYGEWG